jgi:hypothetical protein
VYVLDDEDVEDEIDMRLQQPASSPSSSVTRTADDDGPLSIDTPLLQSAPTLSHPSVGSATAEATQTASVDLTAILALVTDLEKTRFDIRDQRGYYQRMVREYKPTWKKKSRTHIIQILAETGKLREVERLLITGNALPPVDMKSIRDQIESCGSRIEDLENERNIKVGTLFRKRNA